MVINMDNLILTLPAISNTNYFTKELIVFVLIFAALFVGILVCFWGYKYFQSLFLIVCGLLSGYIGVQIMIFLTEQPVLQMCFFVIFTFLGCCLFYFLSIIFDSILKAIKLKNFITKRMCVISSFLGAAFVGFILYWFIYRDWRVCLSVFLVLMITGILCQKKNRKKRPDFHCYEDIYKLKPIEEKEKENA